MLTWHDCITQLLRVRLIWCSLSYGLGLAQLCYGPLSWEHSLCWLLPEHTCSNNKMKLWWKSFFLQKCKVQVNTSSWHSQLCGLLLWHSAKVLTGFIKSFISKLYKKGKMVVGVWRKVSNICEASFPDRPQLSTYQYPVQRGVQASVHTAAISTLILSSSLITSSTQSQSPVQAFGTLWLHYFILNNIISVSLKWKLSLCWGI